MHIDKDLVAASATPLVLGILAEGESYGYAILKRVNELSESRLNPERQPPTANAARNNVAIFGARTRLRAAPPGS